MERMWREHLWANLGYCPGFCLEWLRKTMKKSWLCLYWLRFEPDIWMQIRRATTWTHLLSFSLLLLWHMLPTRSWVAIRISYSGLVYVIQATDECEVWIHTWVWFARLMAHSSNISQSLACYYIICFQCYETW